MDIRNAVRRSAEVIDCEIEHPVYGWIPFTATTYDVEQSGRDIFAAIEAGDAGAIADYVPPAPTDGDVNTERARRILAGRAFDIAGYGLVAVEGRDEDVRNLGALGTAALAQIGAGNGTGLMQFRDADNVIHDLTWAQMFALWSASTEYVSALYAASWALKDDGIPADFIDAAYWP
jgi:hypothetical protein